MAATVPTDLADVLREVRRIEVRARRLATGVMAGGWASVFRGPGLEFDSVREYVEGDDPRAVDWSVTARMGRPFVRTHVDERDLTVLFLLDLSASMDAGFSRLSPRHAAARVIASLGLTAVRSGDRVGLIAFDDGLASRVRPRKGAGHVLRLVRDALALPARGSGAGLERALVVAARAARRHAIVFLLSDFQGPLPHLALGRCARRHDLVAVRLLPSEMRDLPPLLFRARDPETGRETVLDGTSPRVRAAWRERVRAHDARVEETLERARVDRVDVPLGRERDPEELAIPLLRFFRMREQRGTKR